MFIIYVPNQFLITFNILGKLYKISRLHVDSRVKINQNRHYVIIE